MYLKVAINCFINIVIFNFLLKNIICSYKEISNNRLADYECKN